MSRVLVITGGPDHAHDFYGDATGTGPALARVVTSAGHRAELTDDVEGGFRAAGDGDCDVVVLNALRWRMDGPAYEPWRERWALSLSDGARQAIERFVGDGGGLVGNHTASICFDDWSAWGDLLGGGWVWGHSSHPPPGPVVVELTGCEHPVTAGLPASFELVDEVYGDQLVRADTTVLATSRRTPDDEPQPVVWVRTQGAGRVVYDAFGHDVASLEAPVHQQLLRQAVAWAAGDQSGEEER